MVLMVFGGKFINFYLFKNDVKDAATEMLKIFTNAILMIAQKTPAKRSVMAFGNKISRRALVFMKMGLLEP